MSELEDLEREARDLKKREAAVREREVEQYLKTRDLKATREWVETKRTELSRREAALSDSAPEDAEFEVEIPEHFDEQTKGLCIRIFGMGAGWTPERCTGLFAYLGSMDPQRRREEAQVLLNSIASDNLSPEDLSFEVLTGSRSILKSLSTTKLAIEQAGTGVVKQLAMMNPEEADKAASAAIEAMEDEIQRIRKLKAQGRREQNAS
jgi:hypothetical protein